MRIAYLIAWRGGADSGPFRKMASQVRTWVDAGHEVGLFVATSAASAEDWRQIAADHHYISERSTGTVGERRRRARAAEKWRPDLVYERHGLYYPGRRRLTRRVPVVTEINSNDLHEWSLVSPRKALYNKATRARGLAGIAGLVFVTAELRDAPGFRRYSAKVPSLVLGNGIALSSVPRAPARSIDGPPRLVFIGHHHSPWHGIGDVLALAKARQQWRFDIIGLTDAEVAGAHDNVVNHGQLPPAECAAIIGTADIGIGSLALYRERIREASTLKVREYLAAGLPVVLGGQDTDFPDGAPFLMQVPNAKGGILTDLDRLDAFVARWRGQRVAAGDVGHLDVSEKERIRLSFFEQVRQGAET